MENKQQNNSGFTDIFLTVQRYDKTKGRVDFDIDFIMKHPVSQCPYCATVMNFKPDTNIVNEYKNALNQIQAIQDTNTKR